MTRVALLGIAESVRMRLFALLFVMLCAPTALAGEAYVGPLKVLRSPELVIEPATNRATGSLELQNLSDVPQNASLYAGDFGSAASNGRVGGEVTFALGDEPAVTTKQLSLGPRQRVTLKLTASGLWDAGLLRAPLFLDDRQLGELRAQKLQVPFNVKLADGGSHQAPLNVEVKRSLVLRIENADPMSYGFQWTLTLGGAAPDSGKGRVAIGASSSVDIPIQPAEELFPNCLVGLFRRETRQGVLTLRYADAPAGGVVASRTFPVHVTLDRHAAPVRTFVSTVLTFIILALGGLSSLYLTYAVPNALRRLAVRGQLNRLGATIATLSELVPSQLLVDLRVRQQELSMRMARENMFFPGFSEVLDHVSKAARQLEERAGVVDQADNLAERLHAMGERGLAHLLEIQHRVLSNAFRRLASPRDGATIDPIVKDLDAVAAKLDLIDQDDAQMKATLFEEAKAFYSKCFAPAWSALPAQAPWLADLREKADPFELHARKLLDASAAAPPTLTALDTLFAKLELLYAYICFCREATPRQHARFDEVGLDVTSDEQLTQRQRFFECWSGSGWRALNQAELVLRQAKQGIFVKHVAQQIRAKNYTLRVEPTSPSQLGMVMLSLVFHEDKFNDAAAREKLDCEWRFTDESIAKLARGWRVFHFFEQPGTQMVEVRVHRGEEAMHKDTLEIGVRELRRPRVAERTKLELVQLAVALGVTMGALLAGARDQLEKLDIATGCAAVFAIGFGADIVKNLVARKPGPAESTPARTPS